MVALTIVVGAWATTGRAPRSVPAPAAGLMQCPLERRPVPADDPVAPLEYLAVRLILDAHWCEADTDLRRCRALWLAAASDPVRHLAGIEAGEGAPELVVRAAVVHRWALSEVGATSHSDLDGAVFRSLAAPWSDPSAAATWTDATWDRLIRERSTPAVLATLTRAESPCP